MIIAADPAEALGPRACEHLAGIPYIWLGAGKSPIAAGRVTFATATYGIHTPGTVYRVDDVPLPLRPSLDSPRPSDVEVLSQIEHRVRQRQQAKRP